MKEIALNIQETKYHSIIRDIKLDFVQAYIKQSFEEEDVLSHQILIHFYTTGFIGLVDLFLLILVLILILFQLICPVFTSISTMILTHICDTNRNLSPYFYCSSKDNTLK